jgi:hypothetical protein
MCHYSRKEIIILKLDFEKEFDKVEHDFMLQIMDQKRLPPRWLQWMKALFKSGTSTVLLNGIPRKVFHCRRGVRQGDPSLLSFLCWQQTSFIMFLTMQGSTIS